MKLKMLKRGIYITILAFLFSCQEEVSSLEKSMYQKLMLIKTSDKADKQIAGFDSLILSLVDYYEHRGSKLKLAEAYYYAGRVFYEKRDFPKALRYYNRAVSVLPSSDTPELEGFVYSQIGYLFSLQELSEEAISAFNHSYLFCKSQEDTLGMIFGLRDMGKEMSALGRYKNAERILLESIQLAKDKRIDYMYYGNKSNLADLYCKLHDYQKAKVEINEALTCIYGPDSSGVLATAANIYMTLGMVDSAEYYSKKLLDIGTIYARCSANERLAEIAIKRKQPVKAIHYLKLYKKLNDSINATTTTETVAKINGLYNYQRQEEENAKLRESNLRKNYFILMAIFIILIFVLIFIAVYLHNRKQKEMKLLRSEILEQARMWRHTQEEKFIAEKRRKMIKECDIYKRFDSIIGNNKNNTHNITDEDWRELEQSINSIYPRFSETLENLCNISTTERRICMLRKINIPPTQIAILLNKSKQAIGSARVRLYEKSFGEKGSSSQWDEFLQSI